jgi:uncharacterized protein (TIGR03663 family)
VNTISTKSRNKRPAIGQQKQASGPTSAETQAAASGSDLSERAWQLSSLAILFVGAFLRLFKLTLVPLHHDEGVNGNFLVALVREGPSHYQYNPENYHGPTLYFFSAVIPWIVRFFGGKVAGDTFGLTTFNVRLVTAAFGIATIWLALTLRKRIGTIGALCAAGLIAISPGAVYLSRYFIHEALFVFFTLAIVVAALKYYETGRGLYLILASISAALMFATKETWLMNGPVLLIAWISTAIYFWVRESLGRRRSDQTPLADRWRATIDRLGGVIPLLTMALTAFAVFIVVAVLFYSSFFTNYPKGVSDALKTLNLWRQRTHEHEHPWWQYIYWLVWEEGALMLLGGFGALIALWRANNRMALFLAQWSFGLLAAYSLVGYKTPWISLNFIVPLALLSGYTLEVIYQKLREFQEPALFLPLPLLIVGFCGYQLYQLNFVHYDDDQLPYVYAHTKRGMLAMLDQIERIGQKNGTGEDTGVAIVSPDYWPLPWYFRNYKRVGYYSQIVPTTEAIIIGSEAQEEQLKATYGDRYDMLKSNTEDGAYPLRPGVDLVLYVRRDVKR